MKKVISVFLSVLMIFSVCAVGVSAYDYKENDYPVLMIEGQGHHLYTADGEKAYPAEFSTDEILEKVKGCLPSLAKALVTGDYTEYAGNFRDAIAPYYEKILLDENGDRVDGSYFAYENVGGLRKAKNKPYDYAFGYDWRLDPFTVSESLDKAIDKIIAQTGKSKVNVSGRCMGSNILAAYMADEEHLAKLGSVCFYASAMTGTELSSELFAGRFDIDTVALKRFAEENGTLDGILGDPVISNFVLATIDVLNALNGFDIPMDELTKIVKKIYKEIAPEVMMVTYGNFPSYWAMVSPDDYEEAKSIIFRGQEEKYAGLIKKIDNYQAKISNNTENLLFNAKAKGVKVYNVVKYNIPAIPLFESSNELSDLYVSVNRASLGATASKYAGVLSQDYLKNSDMKYVSSDRMIDASTALLPDNTWFLKDIEHTEFPDSGFEFINKLLKSEEQLTVFDREDCPQFMKYDRENDSFAPLTDEPNAPQQTGKLNLIQKFIQWIKSVLKMFGLIFKKK